MARAVASRTSTRVRGSGAYWPRARGAWVSVVPVLIGADHTDAGCRPRERGVAGSLAADRARFDATSDGRRRDATTGDGRRRRHRATQTEPDVSDATSGDGRRRRHRARPIERSENVRLRGNVTVPPGGFEPPPLPPEGSALSPELWGLVGEINRSRSREPVPTARVASVSRRPPDGRRGTGPHRASRPTGGGVSPPGWPTRTAAAPRAPRPRRAALRPARCRASTRW